MRGFPHIAVANKESINMSNRRIRRGTILFPRVYGSEEILPSQMMDEVHEIVAKGYHAVEIFPLVGEEPFIREFCAAASSLGLEIWVLTNYMKYQENYLAAHPEQKVVLAQDRLDSDGLSTSGWGCPYNPEFKKRGIDFLREVALQPGVTRIGLNDEALLLSGCYCHVCRADFAREIGGEMPLKVQPKAEDWEDETWRRYIQWKLKRWSDVHAEMARAIYEIAPDTRVLFQTSPACDLWLNPWETGVDLSDMVESLDGLSTDPYYTFHGQPFHPAEVYLSEWCRFLHGIVPAGKEAEIVVQGFSHPTFLRPLGREDGYWSALVPVACGIDIVTPYTYSFQKCSPVQETYEASFAWDKYFEQVEPLKYAAVVHSSQSEVYAHPLPAEVPNSYDWTRLLPVGESLRHHGLPYTYMSDRRVEQELSGSQFKVLLLPEVNCLSKAQEEAWKAYIAGGGNLVIFGDFGNADEVGNRKSKSLLQELFGIEVSAAPPEHRHFEVTSEHPAVQEVVPLDQKRALSEMGGSQHPVFSLKHAVKAKVGERAEVLATFEDGDPAVALLPAPGRVLWFAGFPSRTTTNPVYNTLVINRAHSLAASAAAWAAGEKPSLRVDNWPPEVPIKKLRPMDSRQMSTFEFFPLQGEDSCLALITSYFKEPAHFPLSLALPGGKSLKGVRELIENREVAFSMKDGEAIVDVALNFDSAARLYYFDLSG